LCDLFGSATKRGRLAFRDSTITGSQRQTRNHVAIDRISGGARDKLLFTDEVVVAGRISLTITCLGPVAEWQRNLLLHVVRDIHDGLIGVGGGAQRGQGTLRLADASHPAITGLRPMPATPPAMEATHD
jgi:CRISPR/Cas system CSM-associated protein Csm3 (group 7 of RAMP superfamily)